MSNRDHNLTIAATLGVVEAHRCDSAGYMLCEPVTTVEPAIERIKLRSKLAALSLIARSVTVHGRAFRVLMAAGLALATAACTINARPDTTANATPSSDATTASVSGVPTQQIPGQPVSTNPRAKIALLLPLTGNPQAAVIAKGMKQAAEMALFDANNPNFELTVKDTRSTPDGAAAAVTRAASEGAELILGPLFAKNVKAVSPIARQAGLPVIAFSNDRTVAGGGVYLLSFQVNQEVERIISFAASQQKYRYAALLPDNKFGQVVEQAFRSAVATSGGQIVAIEKYASNSNGILAPSQQLFETVKQAGERGEPIDAIFLPGGPDTLPSLAPLVSYANVGAGQVKFLGTGGWDISNLGRNKNFIGSWFPAPDPRGWRAFSQKFRTTFGTAPPRIATLAHDATTLAIELAGTGLPGQRYVAAQLMRPNGFVGIDGPFSFVADGTARHALAIHEVQQFATTVIQPPPTGPVSGSAPTAALAGARLQ